jgi:hypothetical protein
VQASGAFCRSTTECNGDVCDASVSSCSKESCKGDAKGCPTEGVPVRWRTPCLSFSVNSRLSAKYDPKRTREVVIRSFQSWTGLTCKKCVGTNCISSLRFKELPTPEQKAQNIENSLVSCARTDSNASAPNANLVFFSDYDWVYKGSSNTLARTSTYKNVKDALIVDADIQINSYTNRLNIDESDELVRQGYFDLQSILTHEIGHFIGLAHSGESTATMWASYDPKNNGIEPRTLEEDDIDAVCEAYPPGEVACDETPLNGFSGSCSETESGDKARAACSAVPWQRRPQTPLWAAGFALVIALLSRRKGRHHA